MKNREIKFRVWQTNKKEWVQNNMLFEFACETCKFNEVFTDRNKHYGDDFLVFQQFTGRKDSKGVEIYEGDIINVSGGLHIIEWRGAGFACTWSGYNLDTCWFVGGGPIIVGNTCENPDLAEWARKSCKL